MWCERCETTTPEALHCGACGRDDLEARIAYRDRIGRTLRGWRSDQRVSSEWLATALRQLDQEKTRLLGLDRGSEAPEQVPIALEPPPLPPDDPVPPPPPLPLPSWPTPRAAPPREAPPMARWLRQSAGWMAGAALTAVGSLYLAGTLWEGWSAIVRTIATVAFLAVWSLGAAALGRRMARRGLSAGLWLVGVGATLAPIQAMAAGTLWPDPRAGLILAAVGLVQGVALARAANDLAPGAGRRLWVPWLGLVLCSGMVPLGLPSAVPTVVMAIAMWGHTARPGGPSVPMVALLVPAWLLPLGLGGVDAVSAAGPHLAVAAAVVLYLDLAAARWRGLRTVDLLAWRGLLVITLALLAVCCTVATLAPLPQGRAAFGSLALVAGVLALGTVAWSRARVIHAALLAALGAALTLPSLAGPLRDVVMARASHALGYGGADLPLAWQSLLVVPAIAAVAAMGPVIGRTGWRLASDLQWHLRSWLAVGTGVALGLSATQSGDPRPFLLAAPALLGLGSLRPWSPLPAGATTVLQLSTLAVVTAWLATLLRWLGVPPEVAQGAFTLALLVGLARWPARQVVVSLCVHALVLGWLGPLWSATLGVGLVTVVAAVHPGVRWFGLRALGFGVGPALLGAGIVLAGGVLSLPLAVGLALATALGLLGAAEWVRRAPETSTPPSLPRDVQAEALSGWTVGFLGLAVALAWGAPWDLWVRAAALGGLAAVVHRSPGVRWAPGLGVLFALGACESVFSMVHARLGFDWGLGAGMLVAVGLVHVPWPTWAKPAAVPALRYTAAAWVAVTCVLAALQGLPVELALVQVPVLVGAAWALAPSGSRVPAWLAIALGATVTSSVVPSGLALGLSAVPWVGPVAALVALGHGVAYGVTGAGWVGLAGAVGALARWAHRDADLRVPAVLGIGVVVLLAWEGLAPPGLEVHLLAVAGAASVLCVVRTPWSPATAQAAHVASALSVGGLVLVLAQGHATPLSVLTAGIAGVVAARAGWWWVMRAAVVVGLIGALQWAALGLEGWLVAGTLALVAHRLVFDDTSDAVWWLHRVGAGVGAVCVVGVIVSGPASGWPLASLVPLLAWVVGVEWVLGGLVVSMMAAGFAMGLTVVPGVVLAAGVATVSRDDAARSLAAATLTLAAALSWPVPLELVGLTTVALAWRWLAPPSPGERILDPVLVTAALVASSGALLSPEIPSWTLALAGAATLFLRGPRWQVGVLGTVGTIWLAVAFALQLGPPFQVAFPFGLAALSAVALWRDRPGADVQYVLAALAPWAAGAIQAALLLEGPEPALAVATLQAAVVAGIGFAAGRRAAPTFSLWASVVGAAFLWIEPGIDVFLLITAAVGWGATRLAPVAHHVLRAAVPLVAIAVGLHVGPLGAAVVALSLAAEFVRATRSEHPDALWLPALQTLALLLVARLHGPLLDGAAPTVMAIALGVATAFEAGTTWHPQPSARRVRPLHLVGRLVLVAAGLDVVLTGQVTPGLFTLAGAWFCVRHVFRRQLGDLVAGALLLDAAALLLAVNRGWSDPLAYVAPVGLSALVVAQALRGRVSPTTIGVTRYAAAGAMYVAGFGQMVMDPLDTVWVILLSVAGIGAGQALRVRSFLHLGLGVLAAALTWNLLRFGWVHAWFWAVFLTSLGLAVLTFMVVVTTHREALVRRLARLRSYLAEWEH